MSSWLASRFLRATSLRAVPLASIPRLAWLAFRPCAKLYS